MSPDFRPREATRGELLLEERLNGSSRWCIEASRRIGVWQTRLRRLEIFDTPAFGLLLRADGATLVAEREAFAYHENLVHPVLTAHAAPKKVLIVGGGDGGAAAQSLKHPSVEQVTLCEPDAQLLELAREHFAAVHCGAFDDRRLELRLADGAAFLRQTQDRFDLVVLDPARPEFGIDGSEGSELLRRCRAALAPGGALALPIGLPAARPERVGELAQRLNGLFRVVRPCTFPAPLWGAQCALAVCSDKLDPKSFTADEIDRRIEQRRLQGLRFYNGETHEGVFALPNDVRELVAAPRLKLHPRGRRLGLVR